MYCSQCGSAIDYRFPTTCLNCNHDLREASTESQLLKQADHKTSSRLKVRHHLANLTLILIATVTGLFAGAVVTLFGSQAVYFLLRKFDIVGRLSCGDGSVLGLLMLIGGANVGSVCGGLFGFARRAYRNNVSIT